MLAIVQMVQQISGWSRRRLIPALGLVRASVSRWTRHVDQGLPAIRSPGRAKAPLVESEKLTSAITALRHGVHRSPGAPALWRQWQPYISRQNFNAKVHAHRQEQQRLQREQLGRVIWKRPCTVWAMDPAKHAGVFWNLVGDLGSRFRFELLVAAALPACRIVAQLVALFDRYGAPLILKRDNGSNLANPAVDELLLSYGVIALTSPVYYPRYNGAIEYAQRELKASVGTLTDGGASLDAALAVAPVLLNEHPRRCLGGNTADTVFHLAQPEFRHTYDKRRRKEVKEWIDTRAETILDACKECSRRAHDAAWRQAAAAWMQQEQIIEVVPPRKLLPLSS